MPRFEYQARQQFYAQVAGGLEGEASAELATLGASDVRPDYRGVSFSATMPVLYRVCYRARLAARVLAPLASFPCRGPDALYRWVREIGIRDLMDVDERFVVLANVASEYVTHSHYAVQRVKDAIVDQFRERMGRRPSVDRDEPDVTLHLRVAEARATLSLDVSGGAMHRRHYRKRTVAAPIQETVAAAIVRATGWDGERPLVDPCCGSGTLLAEALMHYCRLPALYLRRRFGFERLPDFDAADWRDEREAAERERRELPDGLIAGSDVDADAIEAARANLASLPGGDRVSLRVRDFRASGSLANRTVVANPPHGIRLGHADEVQALCRDLGDVLKRQAPGSSAFIYLGERELIKHIGLRPTLKQPLVSGALDGRLCRYDIYAGGSPRPTS